MHCKDPFGLTGTSCLQACLLHTLPNVSYIRKSEFVKLNVYSKFGFIDHLKVRFTLFGYMCYAYSYACITNPVDPYLFTVLLDGIAIACYLESLPIPSCKSFFPICKWHKNQRLGYGGLKWWGHVPN